MEGKEREIEGRGCGSFNKPRLEFYFLFKMREGFEGIRKIRNILFPNP